MHDISPCLNVNIRIAVSLSVNLLLVTTINFILLLLLLLRVVIVVAYYYYYYIIIITIIIINIIIINAEELTRHLSMVGWNRKISKSILQLIANVL